MSELSHPSEATTIPDALYFAAEEAGRIPQTKREEFVRAVTAGPVEQQLVNIAGELYAMGRKMDRKFDRLESLLRGFIAEMQVCITAEEPTNLF